MTTIVRADAPLLAVALFSDDSLKNPYPDYKRLRDLAPIVRLPRPEVYAIGRFADVQAALRAPDQLINGEGIGFSAAAAGRVRPSRAGWRRGRPPPCACTGRAPPRRAG